MQKDITQTIHNPDAGMAFRLVTENTDFPVYLYPSPTYLKKHRDLAVFGDEHSSND
jgi:hypothetical protein